MIEFIERLLGGILLFGQQMMTGGNIWITMLVMLIAIAVVFGMRGRLTESWIWIPVLALAMWYAIYRWLQLRA